MRWLVAVLAAVICFAAPAVARDDVARRACSRLGFVLRGDAKFEQGTALGDATYRQGDSYWEQPWGENRRVRDNWRETRVPIIELVYAKRRIDPIARAFDDGVGFRFAFSDQPQLKDVRIDEELTEFNLAGIDRNRFAMAVEERAVNADNRWLPRMAAGGGFALALAPVR